MRRWSFTKGHGTENDFVLLLDRENVAEPSPADVAFLCDRHAGVGADGILRAVLATHVPQWDGPDQVWFMDYRNADGSLAQMCGNGVRVFVAYLLDAGLASGPVVDVATRDGLKQVTVRPDGQIRVAMGQVRVREGHVTVTPAGKPALDAVAVDVGNPHAVSHCDDLAALDLTRPPDWSPAEAFPEGVNLEFVTVRGPHRLAMRVFERGVGETRACGTGTVAAVAAVAAGSPEDAADPSTWTVQVPGGTLTVELTPDQAYLTGPAVLVAHGEVTLPDRDPI